MMYAVAGNDDWALTYHPAPPWDAVAPAAAATAWQPVGEIFSARNNGDDLATKTDQLLLFDGDEPVAGQYPAYAYRTGWRDAEALIGVIAASDNHVQLPGVDDRHGVPNRHPHAAEPGGIAVVLVDPALPPREGVFEALRARRTYATTGPRAYVDLTARVGGDTYDIGADVDAGAACAVTFDLTLATPRPIRLASLFAVEVGASDPFTRVWERQRPNVQAIAGAVTLDNPVPPGGAPQRWMYTLRAFTGRPVPAGADAAAVRAGHEDALWTSPVWITWHDAGCVGP